MRANLTAATTILAALWLLGRVAVAEPPPLSEPRPPGGELTVSGESGTVVSVDQRQVGVLPLDGPLWVAAGKHVVTLQRGRKRDQIDIEITAGRPYSCQVDFLGRPSCGTPFAVAVLSEAGEEALARATREALRGDTRVLLVPPRRIQAELDRTPALRACLGELRCQERLGQALRADFVLWLRLQGDALSGVMVDAEVGEPLLQQREPCPRCEGAALQRVVQRVVPRWLNDGLDRSASGVLKAESRPAPAQVLIDHQRKGDTPFERRVFAGAHQVVIARPGFAPIQRTVQVEANQTLVLPLSALQPVRRPFFALKWLGLGLGLAGVGAGATLVALDGWKSCGAPICSYVFDGVRSGVAPLVGGGLALGAAALFFVIDSRASRRERARLDALGVQQESR